MLIPDRPSSESLNTWHCDSGDDTSTPQQTHHEPLPILRAEPIGVTTGKVARVDSRVSASEVATSSKQLKIHYYSIHTARPPVLIPCQGQLDWQLAHESVLTLRAGPTGVTTGKVVRVISRISAYEVAAGPRDKILAVESFTGGNTFSGLSVGGGQLHNKRQ